MEGIRRIELAAFSDKGTVRSNNEDNMYSSLYNITNVNSEDYYVAVYADTYKEDVSVISVFDGMGGSDRGELASLIAAQQMQIFYERLLEKKDWTEEELSDLLFDTKRRMEYETRTAVQDNTEEQPGTTCCGMILSDGMVRPFWIGDSRLYLLRQNQLILLTKDHTIAQEKVDYGLISPEEAVTISSWHYITEYIGDNKFNFSIGTAFSAQAGDKYLLCTDGISDKFSAETLAEYMLESPTRFTEMVTKEVKKSSKDNATAIMIELIPDFHRKDIGDILKAKTKEYFTNVEEAIKGK